MDRTETEEASQPLSLESFSYRWLVDPKPFLESQGNSLRASFDEGSFIELDPRSAPSKVNSFDFRVPQSPESLVPADELFAEGFMLPIRDMKAYKFPDGSKSKLFSTKHVVSEGKTKPIKRKTRLFVSRRLFCKYFDFLRPVYRIIVRGWARRAKATRISVYPTDDSPKTSFACSVDDWRYSSIDSESSIIEAVLHCRRSNGL